MDKKPLPEELPVGLMMRIAQDPCAMEHFFMLPHQRQQAMLDNIRSSRTGEEARSRIESSIMSLDDEQFTHHER